MASNQPLTQRSRCMYCGSVNFGKGCRYGPHGVHFHPDDSLKCAYCGSPNYGKGCRINPINDLHIHGINYNSMFRENVQSFLDSKVFLSELKKDFKEFECFKLGIIDQNGNKIKNPVNEQQKASFTPMIKTIIRLKKYLGPKVELLEVSNLMESNVKFEEDVVQYEKVLKYQDKVQDVVNELYKVLEEAKKDGLSLEEVNKLIQA